MAKVKKRFNRVAARNHSIPPGEGYEFLDATEAGDLGTVELLVSKYGEALLEVREKDWLPSGVMSTKDYSETALIKAVRANNYEMAELLIRLGANVNAKADGGCTPLMRASTEQIKGLLLDHGARMNAKDDMGFTDLMRPHGADILAFLVGREADVHARDNQGRTALMILAGAGSDLEKQIDILLDAGADINAQDNKGQTALIAAAERSVYNDDAMIKVACLLKRGADPDIRDNDGKTAAMHARTPRPDLNAREGQLKAVAELLEQESEKRAENVRRHIVEGGDSSIAVYKPLQLNLKKS